MTLRSSSTRNSGNTTSTAFVNMRRVNGQSKSNLFVQRLAASYNFLLADSKKKHGYIMTSESFKVYNEYTYLSNITNCRYIFILKIVNVAIVIFMFYFPQCFNFKIFTFWLVLTSFGSIDILFRKQNFIRAPV